MRAVLAVAFATGCAVNTPGSPPGSGGTDCGMPTYQIETGVTLSYNIGIDAGYYASYAPGGAWHFEWTCDTQLSLQGCNFTGTIVAPTPAGGANPGCFRCEAQDLLNVTTDASNTTMQFDTLTSTGIDGLDFTAVAGAPIQIDLQIDGIYQNDLVFVPVPGATLVPDCQPAQLAPTTP